MSLGWSGMRRYVSASGHRVVRWLVRVAPKLVSFGAVVFAHELARANCDRVVQCAVPITTGDVRFTLLTPDHFASTQCKMVLDPWLLYGDLSKRGEVYEPMMPGRV